MLEFPLNGSSEPQLVLHRSLRLCVQGVGAARICKGSRESDLGIGPLLEEEPSVRGEEEDGEGPMEHSLLNVGPQMALLLCDWPKFLVLLRHQNTILFHQPDLLGVKVSHHLFDRCLNCFEQDGKHGKSNWKSSINLIIKTQKDLKIYTKSVYHHLEFSECQLNHSKPAYAVQAIVMTQAAFTAEKRTPRSG